MDGDAEDLAALRARLEEEEAAYAGFLGEIDALATFTLPYEALPELPAQMESLNRLWELPGAPEGGGLAGFLRRQAWEAVGPALVRQGRFNALLVQILNGYIDQTARLHGQLRNLMAAMVRHTQRVLPVMDARDRVATALATTRAELILESFDRRQESLQRRLDGLLALRARVEVLAEETGGIRAALNRSPPAAPVMAAAAKAADDAAYVAFENHFRGSRDEIRERLRSYVPLFEGRAPVVDLGCGRGEFLELLREAGIAARGVDGNARTVQEATARGVDVVEADLLDYLRGQAGGALGGLFAAQVAEHLPPAVLQAMLRESFRALRPGGRLVLETVNPRSVVGYLEAYLRDLTHERALHPDTLSFLAAAAGFSDVRVELRSPVSAAAKLQAVPVEDLPPRVAQTLNENVARLNELLYGPQDYALIATR